MKGLILTIDNNRTVIQIHPLFRRYLGKDNIVGNTIDAIFTNFREFQFICQAIDQIEKSGKNEIVVKLPFQEYDVELARIKFDRNMDVRVIKSVVSENESYYLFLASSIEYVEDYYTILRKKEQLFSNSVSILKDISLTVMNEASSKVAARKSIEMVCHLFGAHSAIIRLLKNGYRLEKYISYGLKGEYLAANLEVDSRKVLAYKKVLETKKPVFCEHPENEMGYLYAELSKYGIYKMVVVSPILSGEKVVGILSLGFDKINTLVKEAEDILENVVNELNFILEKSDYFMELLNTTEKLKTLNMEIVKSLSGAIDTRDPYTKGHSERVAAYAVEIARNMKWDDYELERLRLAGLLHDIGKVGIPDAILLKPTALSPHEKEIMNLHPELGAAIISGIENLTDLVPWVSYHHENYDGTGYPYGLKGNEIPLGARILAVADAFDAMTSDRPYRKALPLSKVMEILKDGKGSQWDPDVVEVAIENLEVIFSKTSTIYNIPRILDEFRHRIFNMNLMDGLYLYEYIYEEAMRYTQEHKQFSLAVISLKDYVSHLNQFEKKQALNALIEAIRHNIHYPILVSRYNYYEIILLAPSITKQFMRKKLNKVLIEFFQKTNLFYASNVLSSPEDNDNIDQLLEKLMREKRQDSISG